MSGWLSPIVLEGAHVRLEPLSLDHLDALCEVGLDPELWRWTVSSVLTRGAMASYVGTALEEAERGTALPFATVERRSGRVVGSTRFANADPSHARVEIGWTWLASPWQHTALNTEAKLLMLGHAFERLGCVRVELKTDALNERSRRAILRLGAREEGILRSHMHAAGGRRRDTVYYSILADEWPAVRAGLEERLARGRSAPVRAAASSGAGASPEPSRGAAGDRVTAGAAGDPLSAATSGDRFPAGAADDRLAAGAAGDRLAPTAARTARLPAGFELDEDPARVDLDEVHRFLSTESYWARGRSRADVERLVRDASRLVGLYRDGRQVGFARTVSDGAAFAYLADVYVLPELRGRGLGLELVREAVDGGPFADRRWLLHTLDAHDLYRKVGFGPPGERLLERPAREPADRVPHDRAAEPERRVPARECERSPGAGS
ncbi:MAG TPA: GNAT family N-acetyltransferase [Gemmatimonadota bacterium]